MKTGRKKTVFILAALIVLAVGVTLMGNTLANGVTKNNSAVNAGDNYNVLFQYRNPQKEYVNVPQDASAENVNAVTEGMFWCPGRTEIIYLKLDNQELFATEGTVSVDVYGSGFGETLTYAVIHGETLPQLSSWKEFLDKASESNKLVAGSSKANAKNYVLLSNQPLDIQSAENPAANDYYIAFAIHMDENASNAYQNNSIYIDLKLQVDANYKPGVNPSADDVTPVY